MGTFAEIFRPTPTRRNADCSVGTTTTPIFREFAER
jgi:hypothetical protein